MNKDKFLEDSFIKELSQKRWDTQKANDWYEVQPWFVGCNYIPSTAINQLEMFQEETYNPERIEEELSWAEDFGFNALRIYLHNLLWEHDNTGFVKRVENLLGICDKHGMKVLVVLFDDMWNQNPKLGPQPESIPGIHNSGWVASPGKKRLRKYEDYPIFQEYIQGIIGAFAKDKRILGWDVYNEPGNMGVRGRSLSLMIASISWAREVNPTQPITVGVWQWPIDVEPWKKIYNICVNCSDIISFHWYLEVEKALEHIKEFKKFERPILCTEYMARTLGNTFENHLPVFKKHKIGAFNWGLVYGKTQTIFSWESQKGAPEPKLWFHDILHKNGTPYSKDEIKFIKSILNKN